ncbi:hypothetical protein CYMTET_20788 [Cymbomonas tetramitiformis]|uniref:RRM domain-containing protein n=1 Tax=Cymbomonas tetramitiformis TaxID=36881 RepID=A0AAE0G4N1_9CHLO|nr:hypothetical protein CYMTET_20788 [Cymbomonas tetramitiformis]
MNTTSGGWLRKPLERAKDTSPHLTTHTESEVQRLLHQQLRPDSDVSQGLVGLDFAVASRKEYTTAGSGLLTRREWIRQSEDSFPLHRDQPTPQAPEAPFEIAFSHTPQVGRHAAQVEAAELAHRPELQHVAHLGMGHHLGEFGMAVGTEQAGSASTSRRVTISHGSATNEGGSRATNEVFGTRAPEAPAYLQAQVEEEFREKMREHDMARRKRQKKTKNVTVSKVPRMEEAGSTKEQMPDARDNDRIGGYVSRLISKQEIVAGRLNAEQLATVQGGKFVGYEPGLPSCTLLIKNLAPSVKEADLQALFKAARGEADHDTQPKVRIMQGRMRGWAFAAFTDVGCAAAALHLVHGYVLGDRPLVMYFSTNSKNSAKC